MEIYGKKEFNTVIGYKCDTCGKSTKEGSWIPIRLEFSYGSSLNGMRYDFCNLECLKKFIDDEIKKGDK